MKNYQRLLITMLLFVVAGQIIFLFQGSLKNEPTPALKIADIPEFLGNQEILVQKEIWSARMDEAGLDQAYGEFKDTFKDTTFGTQHMMAHVVGQLLYEKSAIEGLGVCDSTFAFGCYHSFFSQALLGEGLEIIKDLDQACVAKFGPLGSGCQHGIGHGVMEYFGPEKLLPALESCKDTTSTTQLDGCISGVFMEYNVPILITEANASATARPLENNDPYAPCPSLPEKFRASCYYEIPQWWQVGPFHDDFTKHGELCQDLPNKNHEEDCFLGLGNIIAPSSDFVVEESINRCAQMPSESGRVACQAGASWSFDANEPFRNLATLLCDGLNAEASNACEHKAHLLNPENQ